MRLSAFFPEVKPLPTRCSVFHSGEGMTSPIPLQEVGKALLDAFLSSGKYPCRKILYHMYGLRPASPMGFIVFQSSSKYLKLFSRHRILISSVHLSGRTLALYI